MYMPIAFHPKPGMVLICDFHTGFVPPEMVKKRRVIVVSSYQVNKQGLCTIVPVSTLLPDPIEPHHHRIPCGKYTFFSQQDDSWVKCDMITRVSFKRLDRLRLNNEFLTPYIDAADLAAARRGILFTLDLQ